VYSKKLPAIKQAITEVQRVFSTNIFPEMKLDWRTHPNNIGHLYSEGCFRCHDGQHVSKEGKVIARDCNSCHTIIGQENGGSAMAKVQTVTFEHPGGEMDFGSINCNECHTGSVGP